jgi:hypothetical protein
VHSRRADAIAARRPRAGRATRGAAYFVAGALACALGALAPQALASEPGDRARRAHRSFDPNHDAFGVELGFGVLGRTFVYADRGTANLRDYSLWAAPSSFVRAEAWPTVFFPRLPFDLGLVGGAASAFALRSTIDGARIPTSWTRWDVGIAARVGIPRGSARVTLAYGRDRFAFSTSDVVFYELPQVDYAYVRLGGDARIALWRFAALASVGWRFALLGSRDGIQRDTLTERFSHATLGGVDVQLGAALPLLPLFRQRWLRGLELRATLEWTRWFYAMHPALGDEYVAGGALDHMFGLRLGAAWVW